MCLPFSNKKILIAQILSLQIVCQTIIETTRTTHQISLPDEYRDS